MKSYANSFSATLLAGPIKQGLRTSMEDDAASTLSPTRSMSRKTHTVGKCSPGAQLGRLWDHHSPLAKLASPCPQPHPRSTSNTSASPSASPGKMKPSSLSAPHPYLPRVSPHKSSSAAQRLKTAGHARAGRTQTLEPTNMFLEGFQDCATEVLRFLRGVESMDGSSLVQGLQSHLERVGRTICPETIMELEASDLLEAALNPSLPTQAPQTDSRVPHLHPGPKDSVCNLSPIPGSLRSRRCLSLSESSSGIETDLSSSTLSTSINSDTESDQPDVEYHVLDTLGHQQPSHMGGNSESQAFPHLGGIHCLSRVSSSSEVRPLLTRLSPPSLKQLSSAALNIDTALNQVCSSFLPLSSQQIGNNLYFINAPSCCEGLNSMTLPLAPLGQSSPLPDLTHTVFFSDATTSISTSARATQASSVVTHSHVSTPTLDHLSSPNKLVQSHIPIVHMPMIPSPNALSITSHLQHPTDCSTNLPKPQNDALLHILDNPRTGISPVIPLDTDPAITWCQGPPQLSLSSLRLLAAHPSLIHPPPGLHPSSELQQTSLATGAPHSASAHPHQQASTATAPIYSNTQEAPPNQTPCTPQSPSQTQPLPQQSNSLLHQMSSILELRPNFLPGVDSSSVASGNFADILLAVESCRSHEDHRVRTLAEELINLFHNDDADDGDDENIDEENDGGEENGNESGIEIDESTGWGNPEDMIEQ